LVVVSFKLTFLLVWCSTALFGFNNPEQSLIRSVIYNDLVPDHPLTEAKST